MLFSGDLETFWRNESCDAAPLESEMKQERSENGHDVGPLMFSQLLCARCEKVPMDREWLATFEPLTWNLLNLKFRPEKRSLNLESLFVT